MVNRLKKTLTALACTFALAALLSVSAFGVEGFRLVQKTLTDNIDVGLVDCGGVLRASSVPSSYDLRAHNRVTPVKNQGDYGSCWAFAAAAAGESSLLTENPGKYAGIDLSELHMLYFSFQKTSDPLGGTEGDGVTIPATQNFLDIGNNFYGATFELSKWVGAAKESVLSYDLASPRMNVSADKAFDDTVHLENAEWISMKDRQYLKKTIMNKGAVATSYFCYDDRYFNEDTGAYYCNRSHEGNHAVTIIGWDDNYSKNNFGGSTGSIKPASDGAWLVKASYGTDYGNNGYIWISYNDVSLNGEIAAFFDYAPADNYTNNYQYDGGQSFGYYEVKSGAGYMANTFRAKNDEILKAVSFSTADANTRYDIAVFTDIPASGVPVKGTAEPQSETSGIFQSAGYHTVKLPGAVTLDKDSRFSVVIRLQTEGDTTKLLIDSTSNMGSGVLNVTKSQKQQSVISRDGKEWLDLYSDSEAVKSGTNFRIKAFTDNGYVKTTSASFKSKTVTVEPGKTQKLNITFTPSNATGRCTWTSSDPSVAKVSSAGEVTGVSCGSCTVTAKSVRGGSTASCVIKVKPGKVTGLKSTVTGDTSYKLTWNGAQGASVYRIYRYNSSKDSFAKLCDVTATSYTVKNAVPGAVARYKVCAVNTKNGECLGDCSSVVYAASVKSIGKVSAGTATAASVTLKWSKISGATGYRVYIKNSSGYKLQTTVSGNTCTVKSLKSQTKYVFRVAAYVKTPSGTYEGKASADTAVYTKPAKAASLRVGTRTTSSLTLRWNAVSRVDGYYIYKYSSADKTWKKCGSATSASKRISGLSSGTVYKFKVRAYKNLDGKTVYGEYSTVLTCCTTPAKMSFKSVTRSGTKLTLKWNRVKADGYELYVKAGSGSFAKKATLTQDKSGAVISGAKKGVNYYFKIRAYVTAGGVKVYSPFSASVRYSY